MIRDTTCDAHINMVFSFLYKTLFQKIVVPLEEYHSTMVRELTLQPFYSVASFKAFMMDKYLIDDE